MTHRCHTLDDPSLVTAPWMTPPAASSGGSGGTNGSAGIAPVTAVCVSCARLLRVGPTARWICSGSWLSITRSGGRHRRRVPLSAWDSGVGRMPGRPVGRAACGTSTPAGAVTGMGGRRAGYAPLRASGDRPKTPGDEPHEDFRGTHWRGGKGYGCPASLPHSCGTASSPLSI
jgi:hypothetical protein